MTGRQEMNPCLPVLLVCDIFNSNQSLGRLLYYLMTAWL